MDIEEVLPYDSVNDVRPMKAVRDEHFLRTYKTLGYNLVHTAKLLGISIRCARLWRQRLMAHAPRKYRKIPPIHPITVRVDCSNPECRKAIFMPQYKYDAIKATGRKNFYCDRSCFSRYIETTSEEIRNRMKGR